MSNTHLNKVNHAIHGLIHASSTSQLENALTESAILLGEAQYGQLYLYTKDRLKKMYSSNVAVKKLTITKHPEFKKLLHSEKFSYISQQALKKWTSITIPKTTESIIILPLFHKNVLGYIVLYRLQPEDLTTEEKGTLQLYVQTAILALTKARLQEESKQALEIRDRFISLASHELRTPLTSLHGYIQLLHARMQKNNSDSVESRWIKELHVESIRLTTLVKELLDVNRIKQGQFDFVFSEVPMNDVITRAVEYYKITMSDHPIVYNNSVREEESHIVGDFDKLVEMVSGLLGNAIKFSKPSEKITVSLKATQGMLSLVVKDTGKGISKKDLNAVFDGFYKSSQASHLEGMGVGLLLAKHIVENHRGKIKITSKENKGTKVEVLLPIIKSSPV